MEITRRNDTLSFEYNQIEKDKAQKEQELSRIITDQKMRIENLLTDIDCNERNSKQSIQTLTNKLEQVRREKQSIEMEM